jgi:hypothetical protein
VALTETAFVVLDGVSMGYVPSVAVTILKKNVVVKFLKMKKNKMDWICYFRSMV